MNYTSIICEKGVRLFAPESQVNESLKSFTCPASCPKKIKGECSNTQSTIINKYNDSLQREKIEKKKMGPIIELGSIPSIKEEKNEVSQPETTQSSNAIPDASNQATPKPRMGIRSFGASKTEVNKDTEEYLAPSKEYDVINIHGKRYSDNKRYAFDSLKVALKDIISYWQLDQVFDGYQLKDQFVYVICKNANTKIKKEDVDKILNNNSLDASTKFFYLIYDVIYKNHKDVGGFYFSDQQSTSKLTPIFRDKDDFAEQYADEDKNYFREFYRKHKAIVWSYLNYSLDKYSESEIENKLVDDITMILSKKGELVYIDSQDVFLVPHHLGSILDFKKSMTDICSFKEMSTKVAFLKNYRLLPNVFDGVVKRDENYKFHDPSEDRDINTPDIVYKYCNLTESANYASQFNYYLALVREYLKTFNDDQIEIGDIVFTKSNYHKDIRDNIVPFLQAALGDHTNVDLEKYRARAYLTKSIYQRKVLPYRIESEPLINKLMDEIDHPTIKGYYELFDRINFMYAGRLVSIQEYIMNKIDTIEAGAICSWLNNDQFIEAYFDCKISSIINYNNAITKFRNTLNSNKES